jgi:hypothetical protein
MFKTVLTFFFFSLLLSYQAQAGRLGRRQANQRARIRQGVNSGELTRGEQAKANGEERGIRRAKKRAESDGTVTPEEQAKLKARENRASRSIRRLKHNNRTRSGTGTGAAAVQPQ